MISCTKKIEFDCAHRIINHFGACKMLHGHRYVLEVTFSTKYELMKNGMVIDFTIIKERLNHWLKENWDHNTILSIEDKDLGDFINQHTGQKVFFLNTPPTAENMALYLYQNVIPLLFGEEDAKCTNLRLYETPNSFVDIPNYNPKS